jgi:hypothetical protein
MHSQSIHVHPSTFLLPFPLPFPQHTSQSLIIPLLLPGCLFFFSVHMKESMCYSFFCVFLILLNMVLSISIYFAEIKGFYPFLWVNNIPVCIYTTFSFLPSFHLSFFCWQYRGLNSGLHTCKAGGVLPLKPHFQPFCFGQFRLKSYFMLPAIAGITDKCIPPCPIFSLLRWGSHKLLCPGWCGTTILPISASCIACVPLHPAIS